MQQLKAKIAAILAVIRQFETNNDYTAIYGGKEHFSDFSRHPNIAVPIGLPGYDGKFSTAAGAYQINHPTYQDFAHRIGVIDFTPETQDKLARAILESTGAVQKLEDNDIPGAFSCAAKRWASLPGSIANQKPKSLQVALDTYSKHLG